MNWLVVLAVLAIMLVLRWRKAMMLPWLVAQGGGESRMFFTWKS